MAGDAKPLVYHAKPNQKGDAFKMLSFKEIQILAYINSERVAMLKEFSKPQLKLLEGLESKRLVHINRRGKGYSTLIEVTEKGKAYL